MAKPTITETRRRLARALLVTRRQILLRRRIIASLCAVAAVLVAFNAQRAVPLDTVLVAARQLPAGHVLATGDLSQAPYVVRPEGLAVNPVGKTLLAPVMPGEPIMASRLEHAALVSARPGQVAMPVRIGDRASVELLRAGDVIDLISVAPDGTSSQVLLVNVSVLSVPAPAAGLNSDALPGRLIVVAAPQAKSTELADAALRGHLTFTW